MKKRKIHVIDEDTRVCVQMSFFHSLLVSGLFVQLLFIFFIVFMKISHFLKYNSGHKYKISYSLFPSPPVKSCIYQPIRSKKKLKKAKIKTLNDSNGTLKYV